MRLNPYQFMRMNEIEDMYEDIPYSHYNISTTLTPPGWETAPNRVEVTRDMVQQAVDAFPLLTILGAAIPKTREEEEQLRQQLLNKVDRIQATVDWLQRIEATKHVNYRAGTSYGLKHIAERDIGYIQNGIFICAAYLAGFKTRTWLTEPNTEFNMTVKSIKAARKQAGDLY